MVRYSLRGNRYLNVIASLYGYEPYSELISMANPTSKESLWVNEYQVFQDEDDSLHERVLRAASLRCSSSFVGCQKVLADSFVEVAHQLRSSKSPAANSCLGAISEYPFLQLINSLPDVFILSERKDDVYPAFLSDDEVEEDATPFYSLQDRNDNVAISPCFDSLGDMDAFFRQHLPLYAKYTIDITSSVDGKVFEKVGNLSGYIWNS